MIGRNNYINKTDSLYKRILVRLLIYGPCGTIITFLIFPSIGLTTVMEFDGIPHIYAQQSNSSSFEPNINATNVFDTKMMALGNDIKHIVILLPNEAHESQHSGHPSYEQRIINQPYIPQKAIVSPNTMVIWFNADVDHDHKITLHDKNSKETIFDSGTFAFNEASKPVVLNNTSTFDYFETDVNNEDEDFVMNGELTVRQQPFSSTGLSGSSNGNLTSTNTSGFSLKADNNNIDTIGTYMVPAQDVDKYVSEFTNRGFEVASMHNFKGLRGGQEGTGDEQTLLVWGADSSVMDLDKIISSLKDITPELPYS